MSWASMSSNVRSQHCFFAPLLLSPPLSIAWSPRRLRLSSSVVDGVFLFKSLLKNANPRGCEGRRNALFVRADRFVLHAGSALVRGGQDLAASPIFRGIGLQSIEPQKSNRSFVFQKNQGKTQLSKTTVAPCRNLFNSNRPFTHEKIASSRVSSHPPPNKVPLLNKLIHAS